MAEPARGEKPDTEDRNEHGSGLNGVDVVQRVTHRGEHDESKQRIHQRGYQLCRLNATTKVRR